MPGFRSRRADTGVELMAGETLAIAGLVQSRIESENRGLPWISEVPYLGVPFRSVHESVNEVELLMLVTPELVEAMSADEVPPCGPGQQTTSPQRLGVVHEGASRSAQVRPIVRQRQWRLPAKTAAVPTHRRPTE